MRNARHFWDESWRREDTILFSVYLRRLLERVTALHGHSGLLLGLLVSLGSHLARQGVYNARSLLPLSSSDLRDTSVEWERGSPGLSSGSGSRCAGDHNLASSLPLLCLRSSRSRGWCQSPRYDGGGHTRSRSTWSHRNIGGHRGRGVTTVTRW